ncbi:hypothetical protein Tco_1034372 [Tanacetum coccineum]
MKVQDEGDSLSGDESLGVWVHAKAPLIGPPDSRHVTSKIDNIHVDNVDIQANDSINSLSPHVKVVIPNRHDPFLDLNAPTNHDEDINHVDLDLDELLSSFQRISDNSSMDPLGY